MDIDLGLLGAHLREHEVTPESAVEVERAGYGTLWLAASPPADLAFAERLLDAGADQIGVHPLGDAPVATLRAVADAVLTIRPE